MGDTTTLLVLLISLCGLVSYSWQASPTISPSDTTGDGREEEEEEGEGGPRNEAPITGHTLAVVIGVSVGCVIALVVVVCLLVGRGLKHSCGGSSSYSVRNLESRNKAVFPSAINPISTGMTQEMVNGTNTFPREESQSTLVENQSQSTLVENQSQSTLQSILEENLSQTTLEEDDKKTQSLETTV